MALTAPAPTASAAAPAARVDEAVAVSDRERSTRWADLVVVLARGYLAFLATLGAAALVPVLLGWQSFLVTTGSMEPGVSPGDVVVARPMEAGEQVEAGRVFVFTDPAEGSGGRLLVHRVVSRDARGDWVTQGDANASADVAPVPRESFRARARILVPWTGLPVKWWREGEVVRLAGWLLLTGAALAAVLPSRRGPRRRRGLYVAGLVGLVVLLGLVARTAEAGFSATTRSSGNTWSMAAAPSQRYSAEVADDHPHFYYLLDEASGATVADYSDNGRPGTASAIGAYRQPGALPHNFGYSMGLGSSGRVVSGGAALTDPTTFSLELWFRTTSTAGGKLVGFESGQGTTSASYDRHVTMRTDGRLVYGDWNATQIRTITTPAAYNDGAWHHLVLTAVPSGSQQNAVLYVDGQAVVTGTTSRTTSYAGWWRVGYGRVRNAFGLTTNAGFAGQVDQVAVYRTALSSARVQAHYAAR